MAINLSDRDQRTIVVDGFGSINEFDAPAHVAKHDLVSVKNFEVRRGKSLACVWLIHTATCPRGRMTGPSWRTCRKARSSIATGAQREQASRAKAHGPARAGARGPHQTAHDLDDGCGVGQGAGGAERLGARLGAARKGACMTPNVPLTGAATARGKA